jgi:hypothetical protein
MKPSSFEEFHDLMGIGDVQDLEHRFLTRSQLKAKYGATNR